MPERQSTTVSGLCPSRRRVTVRVLHTPALYAREGRADDAISSLKRMARIDPDNPDIDYNMACVYSRQGCMPMKA